MGHQLSLQEKRKLLGYVRRDLAKQQPGSPSHEYLTEYVEHLKRSIKRSERER